MNEEKIQEYARRFATLGDLYNHQATLLRLAQIPYEMRTKGQQSWISRCYNIEYQLQETANIEMAVDATRRLSELDRKRIAQCENIEYDAVLLALAYDESDIVRWNLARNPSIPMSVIKVLAHDKCQDVRNCLILNQATPDSVVAKMARSRLRRSCAVQTDLILNFS